MKSLHQDISSKEFSNYWCSDHSGSVFTFDAFKDLVQSFHGYPAPGVLIAGRMVEIARSQFTEPTLFDAISETAFCLPDAIQLLTLCTAGNGWMRIRHLGRYALTFYDKYKGYGFRVNINAKAIENWPEIGNWFFKRVPKKEQNTSKLFEEIYEAGNNLYQIKSVKVSHEFFGKRSLGRTMICPICEEAFPENHGSVCRGCAGDTPYEKPITEEKSAPLPPFLKKVPTLNAVGFKALHDMTRITPDEDKEPFVFHNETISASDLCQLGKMGRNTVYVQHDMGSDENWIHENDAAIALSKAMAGEGIFCEGPPKEGKITFKASRDGLLVIDEKKLYALNLVENVMCATRQSSSVVLKGRSVGGTRAIPLYISRANLSKALMVINGEPILKVLPLSPLKTGIIITGTEVFKGLIKDAFFPVIEAKVRNLGGSIIGSTIEPDDPSAIRLGIIDLIEKGAELIVLTGGLSVDPDDVTRKAISDANGKDLLYGAPVLPGAMTLIGRIGSVRIIGVPACALYFKTTSFDLLLPKIFAGLTITRKDLARLGHGGFCLNCDSCAYPRCTFGK